MRYDFYNPTRSLGYVQLSTTKGDKIEGRKEKRKKKKKNLFDSRASWKDCRVARLHRRITHRLNLSA